MIKVQEELNNIFEKILTFYTQESYLSTLLDAKEKYFKVTGRLDEEDSEYENRLNCFHDWYISHFLLTSLEVPPVIDYFNQESIDEENNIESITYSLFEFLGENFKKQFVLKDMLHGNKITFPKGYQMPSFVKSDLFIGRTVLFGSENYLMNGFCLLPKEARSILKKQAKKVFKLNDSKKENEFLLNVEALKERARCYSHLEAKKIFIFEE